MKKLKYIEWICMAKEYIMLIGIIDHAMGNVSKMSGERVSSDR
jgi:hypothetical protein